jgi:acyl carrier protein
MTNAIWSKEYEQVLREHLPLLGDQPLEPATNLVDAGLDSLGTVSLLVELEEVMAVAVPDDRLGPDMFATAGGLWDALVRLGSDDQN